MTNARMQLFLLLLLFLQEKSHVFQINCIVVIFPPLINVVSTVSMLGGKRAREGEENCAHLASMVF